MHGKLFTDVKIRSPEVARRLRGMGGTRYVIDGGIDLVEKARHFASAGYNFDDLVRAGRVAIEMDTALSSRDRRYLVTREIRRQKEITREQVAEQAITDFFSQSADFEVDVEEADLILDEEYMEDE